MEDIDIIAKKKKRKSFFIEYFSYLIYITLYAFILKNTPLIRDTSMGRFIGSVFMNTPVIIYILYSSKNKGISRKDLGFKSNRIGDIVLFGSIVGLIGVIIYNGIYTKDVLFELLFYFYSTGIGEELGFRGYFYEMAKKFTGKFRAAILISVLFSLMHIPPQAILQGFGIGYMIIYFINSIFSHTIISLFFIFIKEKTNNIWIPIILHTILNFSSHYIL